MKKVLAFALALIMVFGLFACGGSAPQTSPSADTASTSPSTTPATDSSAATGTPAASDKKVLAYFVGIMQGGAAWSAAQKGFEEACAELGWEGYYVAPSTPNDTTEMVQLTETAITNGADVLIGTYYSQEVFSDVLKGAREKGIIVASTNCFIDEEYLDFWIGTNPAGMGQAQGKALVDLVGDKESTVVYMQTEAGIETQNDQFKAMTEYLKAYPNIKVWGQEYCDSNEVLAAEKISNLVKASPEINAVVCADGNGALGIANYVDESGNSDSFYSVGIDDSAAILNYVLSSALDVTIAQNFYKMGYDGSFMIQSILDGGTIEFNNDSGTVVISADTVEAYAKEKGIELG